MGPQNVREEMGSERVFWSMEQTTCGTCLYVDGRVILKCLLWNYVVNVVTNINLIMIVNTGSFLWKL